MSGIDCPVPFPPGATVQMAHGGGGRAMRKLLEGIFLPAFSNPALDARHDSAVLPGEPGKLAFTTDSYVVRPLFFPGGDIGSLAVFGTVNDLAMAGARPRWLSAAFILEEGVPLETVRRVASSMRSAADRAGVSIVTGDTKVVDRGHGDGVYVCTTGVGFVPDGVEIGPSRVRPGDVVLVSGDVGRHGIAIMSVREGLAFEVEIVSDCAPLASLVESMGPERGVVHCLRDLTRGGLVSALNEIAMDGGVGIEIEGAAVPVSEGVRGACEILGLDPLYVANEGRMVAIVAPAAAEELLERLRSHSEGRGATRIGRVTRAEPGRVIDLLPTGGRRLLDLLSGEQLPRIC